MVMQSRRFTGVSAYPGVLIGYRRVDKRWYPVSVVAVTTTRTQVRMVTGQLLTAARTVSYLSDYLSSMASPPFCAPRLVLG